MAAMPAQNAPSSMNGLSAGTYSGPTTSSTSGAASNSGAVSFDSLHEDAMHDCQFDYYGRRIATASSDRTVQIFDLDCDPPSLIDKLKGHSGPVWAVSWAHPKFGTLLASSSYDSRVIIWKEIDGKFVNVKEHVKHKASVNSIAWAPHEHGLMLACGSSDGYISILRFVEDVKNPWDSSICFQAHSIGVNAVSWAPAVPITSSAGGFALPRLASAGADNNIKIWSPVSSSSPKTATTTTTTTTSATSATSGTGAAVGDVLTEVSMPAVVYECVMVLSGHSDWVRDVSWAPNVGMPGSYLASCSRDKQVFVWTQENAESEFKRVDVGPFADVVWRVSWSLSGDRLAVSCGDNKLTMWRENLEGKWELVRTIEE